MNCPTCRRFAPPGVSRCPACGTVFGAQGAGNVHGRAAGQQVQPAPQATNGAQPQRASAGLRSAVAAALVNYVATKAQQAVQGYQAPAAAAPAMPPPATPNQPAPSLSDALVLPEGMTLASDRFYVGPVLGRGCFGTTYRAVDQRLGRIVAIKEFFPEGSVRQAGRILPPPSLGRDGYEQELGHFIREARILTRVQRPGIVAVHDFFEEHDTAYMVMEYVAGRTLADVLRDLGGPLPVERALRYVLACADALAAVHEQHLLHRDVKPANIMITANDEAVLIDFGAARSFDRYQRTSMMTAIGTPGYAPLEQWGSSGRFGPTSDIYALAATLYHLLTGQMPPSAADRAVQDTLEPPSSLNRAVSEPLGAAVVHGLAVRMDERPQTMAAFAAELRAARAQHGNGSRNTDRAIARPQSPTVASTPNRTSATASPPAARRPATPASTNPPPASPPSGADWKQLKQDLRDARRQAKQAEHDQRRTRAIALPSVSPPAPAQVSAHPSPPALPTSVRRRLPRPLPQNARELALYAVATPGAMIVLAVSLLTLVCASPLLALATVTSKGAPRRVARRALRRSLRLGSQGVVLGTVCIGSLVVVALAVGTGVVFVPLWALLSSQRRRPRRTAHGLRQP